MTCRVTFPPVMSWPLGAARGMGVVAVFVLGLITPASASLPYVVDDGEPIKIGTYEIDITAQMNRRAGETSGVLPGAQINYGATANLQLHAALPVAFDSRSANGTRVGLGDIEFGVKYRIFGGGEGDGSPSVALEPTIYTPTGDSRWNLGTGRTHAFLPVWVSKDLQDWTVFGGGGYAINPGPAQQDWWLVGLGAVYTINSDWSLGAEVFHSTAQTKPGKPGVSFDVGATYNYNDTHHLLMSVGRNLQNAQPNNELSLFIGHQITF